ncbi:metallophosphoesterase family protein [Chitinophaga deserti]|uniref:hypothetical protein n=1 Tax=Chitinophaga deserti TaxID=2164099 RepID=UPI000D6AAD64|nr:hypothetical protein [Chitinophaga deserti]
MSRAIKISISTADVPKAPGAFSIRLKYSMGDPTFWFQPGKLAIMSCIPGNFAATTEILRQLGVINDAYRWSYGDGHLVVLGNCLDGSAESIRLLWWLYGLQTNASKKIGYLHFLPGFREAQHMNGTWISDQPPYAPAGDHSVSQYTILFDGNMELQRWLLTKKAHVKIGNTAIVQCGWQGQAQWPVAAAIPGGSRPLIQPSPSSLNKPELEALRKMLSVKNLVLVDGTTGEGLLYKGPERDSIQSSLPILREGGRWLFPRAGYDQVNPGNPNLPG